jgi:hypothetical protein
MNLRMSISCRKSNSQVSARICILALGVMSSPIVSFCAATECAVSQNRLDAPATRTIQSPSTMLLRSSELPGVVETYRENVSRFKSDFLGKPFFDMLLFLGAAESTKGTYEVIFGTDSLQSGLYCMISSPPEISKILKWNKGDEIHVAGLVKDVKMSAVILDPCALSK